MAASSTSTYVPARRPRVFYGWWIVLGALIAQFVSVGTQAPVSGAFLVPMTEELGWARGEFAIATSVGTFVSALIGFFIGVYVDRYGARPLMVIGATIIGGTLMAISRVDELWQFILLRGVIFTVGFVLIGNLVVNVTLSKWFVRRRGWAISIASIGVSLGSVVITPIMVRVVDEIGWRDAWLVMGLGAWALIYPTALLMRREPEDHGMLPDGARSGELKDADLIEEARQDFVNSYTRSEAVRTFAMWFLVIAFGFGLVGLISVMFHAIPFMTDSGFTRSQAGYIFSLMGVAALVSKFVWGWWMQHFFPRGLAALSFVISGAGVLLMLPAAHAGSLELMAAAFFTFGFGVGGMIPLQEFIWASFFGRRHLGAVRSAAMPASIIFAAGGPIFAGVWNDVVGDYDGALLTFVGMWAIATVLVMLARAPTRKHAPPEVTPVVARLFDRPPGQPWGTATASPEPPEFETPSGVEEPQPAVATAANGADEAGQPPLDPQSSRPKVIPDYGLDNGNGNGSGNGNGATPEPPSSATPALRLPERTTLVKPPLDPSSLDRVLPRRAQTVTAPAAGEVPELTSSSGGSFVETAVAADSAGAPSSTPTNGAGEFIAFEAPPRRQRPQRFVHQPVFDLRELEREPASEPVFERTPEPDMTVEAMTADEVIDPWLQDTVEEEQERAPEPPPRPHEPPPLRVQTERRESRSTHAGDSRRRPPASTSALEVSLGSAARALQRSLRSDGSQMRDLLPAVAAGVATSAVTIGVVMMLRRGR